MGAGEWRQPMTLRNSAETLETSPALHWCAALRSAWQQRRAAMAQPCQYGQVGGAGMEMPKAHTHTHTQASCHLCKLGCWAAARHQFIWFFPYPGKQYIPPRSFSLHTSQLSSWYVAETRNKTPCFPLQWDQRANGRGARQYCWWATEVQSGHFGEPAY